MTVWCRTCLHCSVCANDVFLQLAYVQDKLFIGLEQAGSAFGVKDRILGPVVSALHPCVYRICRKKEPKHSANTFCIGGVGP